MSPNGALPPTRRERPTVPSIGVVIAVYDVRDYLDEALASVARQTCPALEVVVVDDGSEPPVVIEPARHPRLQELRQVRLSENRGLAAARNRGVRELGPGVDTIAFLDADDVWPDDRLAVLVETWATVSPDGAGAGGDARSRLPTPDFVFGRMQNVDADLRPLAAPAAGRMVNVGLIRRAAFDRLDGFNEAVTVGQPIEFMSRAEHLGMSSCQTPAVTLLRRIHGRNMSATSDETRRAYADVVRQHLARSRQHPT